MKTKTDQLQDLLDKQTNRNEDDLRRRIAEMKTKIEQLKLDLNSDVNRGEKHRQAYEQKNEVLQNILGTINKLESRSAKFRKEIEQLENTLSNRSFGLVSWTFCTFLRIKKKMFLSSANKVKRSN